MRAHRSILFVASVFSGLVLSVLVHSQSRGNTNSGQSTPGLMETIDWLKGKTDEIVGVYPLWVSSGETSETIDNDSLTSRGRIVPEDSTYCTFTWHVVEPKKEAPVATATPSKRKKDDKTKSPSTGLIVVRSKPTDFAATSMSFPFSAINPERIAISREVYRPQYAISIGVPERRYEWWVKLYTADKRKAIRWQNANATQESNGFVVAFRTEEMAQRFSKALIHSIKLCGGKPDKREPF
jgi:hypothetical protein